jgi:hypothetical protein
MRMGIFTHNLSVVTIAQYGYDRQNAFTDVGKIYPIWTIDV